jgi:hypothetical protein
MMIDSRTTLWDDRDAGCCSRLSGWMKMLGLGKWKNDDIMLNPRGSFHEREVAQWDKRRYW